MRYLVGSKYFFKDYLDFNPGDTDYLEFEDNPKLYKNFMQFRAKNKTKCIFKWRKMTADEFVDYIKTHPLAMEMGKFLVPEVCEEIGFTLEHLKQLGDVANNLDDRHKYEKVIYDAYIENNGFYLTEEQRLTAYEEYKRARENKELGVK